jgi:hypothetical protein
MDAFKAQEIERMRLGGNKPWRDSFDAAETNLMAGIRSVFSLLGEIYGYDKWELALFPGWTRADCRCECIVGTMLRSQNAIRER